MLRPTLKTTYRSNLAFAPKARNFFSLTTFRSSTSRQSLLSLFYMNTSGALWGPVKNKYPAVFIAELQKHPRVNDYNTDNGVTLYLQGPHTPSPCSGPGPSFLVLLTLGRSFPLRDFSSTYVPAALVSSSPALS